MVVIKKGICYEIHTASPSSVNCLGSFISLLEVIIYYNYIYN